jgi:DNA repair protein RadC
MEASSSGPGPEVAGGLAEASPGLLRRLPADDVLAGLVGSSLALETRTPAPPHGEAEGLQQLGDHELLARLLSAAMPMHDDIGPLAGDALTRFGSFAAVLAAPMRELRGVAGFGMHSVSALKLVHEAALRLSRSRMHDQPVLADPERLMGYLSAVLARERIEQFRILFLDDEDRLLADEAQARGTVNHTPVYPREVARRALELDAAALVLVHNHPSGDPTPSREDLAMTKQVADALRVVGIAVRDHLIVGNGRWTSFRREKLLSGD